MKEPATLSDMPRLELATIPTPLQEARNFSMVLGGPRIFIKRDDLTGVAFGGNKSRKLEYLLADAINQNADTVITAGAVQSNHCLQTAASAARSGLACHLVLGGHPPARPEGNYLIDRLLGATIHFTERHLREQTMDEVSRKLQAEGARPYVIPVGGSNVVGAMGYVKAAFELVSQADEIDVNFDHMIFATSSGGTQAGLSVGLHMAGYRGELTGVSIDQVPDEDSDEKFKEFVLEIVKDLARLLDVDKPFVIGDLSIDYGYLGAGYGVMGDLERRAIRLLAQTEGVLVGPVYTSRALGCLIDKIEKGLIGKNETVLFWHTGDNNVLHAYVDSLFQE